ncbi:hypothetical protein L798_15490 [Zootermopsis nevadensis]|uniref:Uncharacterized protein n=1 Tax=Zootermopsis nevadensis TaxID=136037 RepID=A0A067QWQ9_ZOONE|nr:hypothetical protein L798_15490 [Zootermopsis nevadensis]
MQATVLRGTWMATKSSLFGLSTGTAERLRASDDNLVYRYAEHFVVTTVSFQLPEKGSAHSTSQHAASLSPGISTTVFTLHNYIQKYNDGSQYFSINKIKNNSWVEL